MSTFDIWVESYLKRLLDNLPYMSVLTELPFSHAVLVRICCCVLIEVLIDRSIALVRWCSDQSTD